ncbi:MAG: sigma-54 dependent transcriptional regulator [Desulfotalea sp.]
MTDTRLLIVDDEQDMRTGLMRTINRSLPKLKIYLAANAYEAMEQLKENSFDLALVDIKMPGMDGLELLTEFKILDPWMTVVMMTGHGTIETAVEAIKKGAYDFITKPFARESLLRSVDKGLERNRLLRENYMLRQQVQENSGDALTEFVGDSPTMRDFYYNLEVVARTNYSTLVRGESGTGKELTARAIHKFSNRSDKPLIMVNCPAIPENLLESELFGHTKGAFTDAHAAKVGLITEADGGTICLDEVADLPLSIQSKLLRFLQEGEVRPVGSTKTKKVDVRIIALTNLDIEGMIRDKQFREDLFYRLNVVTLNTPSLRQIREDIPLLVHHFTKQVCIELEIAPKTFCQRAVSMLMNRDWSGNVRELQNSVRRIVMFSRNEFIQIEDLNFAEQVPRGRGGLTVSGSSLTSMEYKDAKQNVLDSFTMKYILAVLQETEGNVTRSAEKSGLTRAALQKIMKRLAINAADYRVEN